MPTPRPEKQEKARSRRRAWLSMKILTALCALAALGIGATQVTSNGLEAFVTRPEGVGATPDAGSDDQPAAAPQDGPAPRQSPAPEHPVVIDPPAHEQPPRHPFPHGPPRGEDRRHHEP